MKKIVAIAILLASPSMASDKVSSPNVEKGKLELEYRGGYDFDNETAEDDAWNNKFVVNYGATDRLRTELKVITDDEGANESHHISGLETSLRYQFAKPDEAWLSSAVEFGYKATLEENIRDRFELKFLFAKDYGNISNLANLSFENYIGRNAGMPSFKFGFATTYKINPHFAPGIEVYGNTGALDAGTSFNEERYSIGPVLHGYMTDKLKYQVGYLFGLTDESADGRAKLILTWTEKF